MGVWIQCTECPTATNSPKQANTHKANTGHTMKEEQD